MTGIREQPQSLIHSRLESHGRVKPARVQVDHPSHVVALHNHALVEQPVLRHRLDVARGERRNPQRVATARGGIQAVMVLVGFIG